LPLKENNENAPQQKLNFMGGGESLDLDSYWDSSINLGK